MVLFCYLPFPSKTHPAKGSCFLDVHKTYWQYSFSSEWIKEDTFFLKKNENKIDLQILSQGTRESLHFNNHSPILLVQTFLECDEQLTPMTTLPVPSLYTKGGHLPVNRIKLYMNLEVVAGRTLLYKHVFINK